MSRKTKEQKDVESLVDDIHEVRKRHANMTHAAYVGTLTILLIELIRDDTDADSQYS